MPSQSCCGCLKSGREPRPGKAEAAKQLNWSRMTLYRKLAKYRSNVLKNFRFLYFALVALVIIIGVLHAVTPGELFLYHDTYRRLSYFPIVLGALFFGLRGGISIAVLSSIFFIPHILLYMGHGQAQRYLGEVMEVVLYMAVGSVTGMIVSRQERLRQQYKLLSEKLERSYARLHEETRLLIEAQEQLSASQKFSALGKLSASLAHEIKNPLSSIKGTAEILLDEFPPGHPKREFTEILLKETSRLNSTVDEVLRYSRGQQGRVDIAPTEPVSHILSRVARLLDGQLRKKAVTLAIGPDPAAAGGLAVDGRKLSQVFLNVILNAIDAVSQGGRINIGFSTPDSGGIDIAISDNGPGVPPEKREEIFKPFFSGKQDSTGLGLSISRKIVESCGGNLTVSDAGEGGACFTIHLPGEVATSPELRPEMTEEGGDS